MSGFRIIYTLVAGASLMLAVASVLEFRTVLLVDSITAASTRIPEKNGGFAPIEDAVPLLEQEELADRNFVPATLPMSTAARLYDAGLATLDQDEQLGLFCRSLHQLGLAIQREPRNSKALMNWANVRQILGGYQCPNSLTQGDFRQVSEFALAVDPVSTRTLFSGAEIALWSGDWPATYARLRQFLTYATDLAPNQVEMIDRLLVGGAPFDELIPARFPQVNDWVRRLRKIDPRVAVRSREIIADLQQAAWREARTQRERGTVLSEQYVRWITDLSKFAGTDAVRRIAGVELERYFEANGNAAMARYYRDRRPLETLDVLNGALSGDTRPNRGVLGSWGAFGPVTLDQFYQSVGFFLPEGETARLIMLESAGPASLLSPSLIRLFGSNDNKSWEEVRENVEVEPLLVYEQGKVLIRIGDIPFRYLKIHYASNNRNGSFQNGLGWLIRVYGYGAGGK